MIERKFTTDFSVRRKTWTTEQVGLEDIPKSEEVEVTSFSGYRQQTNSEYVQSLGLQMSKPHIIWCKTNTKVGEGDILVSSYGVDKVRAVQINRDGCNNHKELIVEFIGSELEEES